MEYLKSGNVDLDLLFNVDVDLLTEQIAELSASSANLARRITAITCAQSKDLIEINDTIKNISMDIPLPLQPTSIAKPTPHRPQSYLTQFATIDPILNLPHLAHVTSKNSQHNTTIHLSHLATNLLNNLPTPLTKEINKATLASIGSMISSLIRLLHTDIKQAHILKIMGILKKIANPLDHLYLNARFSFIKSEVGILRPLFDEGLVDKYLRRVVEVFREHTFQTIMTYHSIFQGEKRLIAKFVNALVAHLRDIVVESWPLVEAKESILDQIVYCGSSLSRIGGDWIHLFADVIPGEMLWKIVKRHHKSGKVAAEHSVPV
ncbi:hypothetical protein DAMA08_028240 [Martiniozyma asiatica (nom. inval.)]|nr:hypothetical protein DAMA08_028240 [Martiniozyma asiatica]